MQLFDLPIIYCSANYVNEENLPNCHVVRTIFFPVL